MSGKPLQETPAELRESIRRLIVHHLHSAFAVAAGSTHGYGLREGELDALREALDDITETLARSSFTLLRTDVLESIRKQMLDREIAEKAQAAQQDDDYQLFRYKLIPRPSWKGNKNSRAEVHALYKPEA